MTNKLVLLEKNELLAVLENMEDETAPLVTYAGENKVASRDKIFCKAFWL